MRETPGESDSDLGAEERLMLEAVGRNPARSRVRELIRGGIDWAAFLDLIRNNGVYVPAAQTLMRHRDMIPPATFDAFRGACLVSIVHDRLMSSQARHLCQDFAKAGIEVVFLKGIHLKRAFYRPGYLRQVSDIDLLVKAGDVAAAGDILVKGGYGYFDGEKRPTDYWLNFSQHLPYKKGGENVMVDLHWNILPKSSPVEIPVDELWSDASPCGNGPKFRFLSAENLLIHLCLHMSLLGFYHVAPLRHLADLERVAHKGLDWDDVADKSRRWRCQSYVGTPLRLVNDCWEKTVPDEVLEDIADGAASGGQTLSKTMRGANQAYTFGDYMSEIYRTDGIGKKISLIRRPIFGRVCRLYPPKGGG